MRVAGSGVATQETRRRRQDHLHFTSTKPSFPGTIIAGVFNETATNEGGVTIRTFFRPNKSASQRAVMRDSGKRIQFFFRPLWRGARH